MFAQTGDGFWANSVTMPCGKALSEVFTVERSGQHSLLERDVLTDRLEVRQERLRPFARTETAHASLTFTRRLMASRPDVHAGSLDEHMFDVRRIRMSAFAAA